MKTAKLVILLALWAGAAVGEVVVLRGGTRIDLKQPPVRQGSTVLLTRRDGTLLSVPVSEIDQQATSAANAAAAAAPPTSAKANAETPASAARAAREGPKARVKLTDADVGHYLEAPAGESGEEKKEVGAGGGARVDVATFTKSKAGENLIVKGTLRNLGTTAALNTRLTVSPLDEKGQMIDSAEASLLSGTIEPGRETNFSASIPVGNRPVGTMRFSPRWVSQATPAEIAAEAQPAASPESGTRGTAAAAAGAAATPGAAASKAPAPVRTPYGQGLTYAAPPPNAPMERPPDGKTGYIPGAATPENQPKPPE